MNATSRIRVSKTLLETYVACSQELKTPEEKVSCARQHLLSHRRLWEHPRDFNCSYHPIKRRPRLSCLREIDQRIGVSVLLLLQDMKYSAQGITRSERGGGWLNQSS